MFMKRLSGFLSIGFIIFYNGCLKISLEFFLKFI